MSQADLPDSCFPPDEVLDQGGIAARGRDSFEPDVLFAYASARPLLHIAILAQGGGGQPITTGSMGRAAWLAEHADELRGYITTATQG